MAYKGEASVDIPAGGNLDLCEAFLSKGVRAWRGDAKAWSGKFDEPLETFGAGKDLLIGIQGDASGSLYVRSGKQGWLSRTYEDELRSYMVPEREGVDLIQTALEYKGVELVAWSRENGVVGVQTKASDKANIDVSAVGVFRLEADGRISYTVEEGNSEISSNRCPLGYGPTLADGKPRSAREWLDTTQDTPFPYAIVRLIQCLTVPGLAPDMIVTAQEGFDIGKDWEYYILNFAGGHGGINPSHLRTPAIFSGKGVVQTGQVVDLATAEDVGASLHPCWGLSDPITCRLSTFWKIAKITTSLPQPIIPMPMVLAPIITPNSCCEGRPYPASRSTDEFDSFARHETSTFRTTLVVHTCCDLWFGIDEFTRNFENRHIECRKLWHSCVDVGYHGIHRVLIRHHTGQCGMKRLMPRIYHRNTCSQFTQQLC